MAKTDKGVNDEYNALRKAISEGTPEAPYIFRGEESYLLKHYLDRLRKLVLGDGMEEFNLKRIEGKDFSVSEFSDAVDALPVFSERTFIEVHDLDIFKEPEDVKEELLRIMSDMPEYACVVFVYDTVEFKCDGRVKTNAALKKLFHDVEFKCGDKNELRSWITRHMRALGKDISAADAEYLAFISGGLMNSLIGEMEKVASFSDGTVVTRADIDATVIPVLDAKIYRMTDAMQKKDYNSAAAVLSDLLGMNEPPHKILFSLSGKLRQVLAAKLLRADGKGISELMELAGIRHDFQARDVMAAAARTDIGWCADAVLLCSDAAFKLNNSSAPGKDILAELLVDIALLPEKGART